MSRNTLRVFVQCRHILHIFEQIWLYDSKLSWYHPSFSGSMHGAQFKPPIMDKLSMFRFLSFVIPAPNITPIEFDSGIVYSPSGSSAEPKIICGSRNWRYFCGLVTTETFIHKPVAVIKYLRHTLWRQIYQIVYVRFNAATAMKKQNIKWSVISYVTLAA